jgi:predicted O-methyltransferase YrrM
VELEEIQDPVRILVNLAKSNEVQLMPQTNTELETASEYQILATAGNKVWLPGGRSATDQLLQWADFRPGETVLELASNLGESAIKLAQRYQVKVVGIERNPENVACARANVAAAGLSSQIEIVQANILYLEHLHEKFDYVLAEAILTSQSPSGKAKILESIKDCLKPGGKFLGHELVARHREAEIHQVLSETIRANSMPLSEINWIAACETAGLRVQHHQAGTMNLLNPWQMIRDEGGKAMVRFLWNICTRFLLRKQVIAMQQVFQQYSEDLGYIILAASLPPEGGRRATIAMVNREVEVCNVPHRDAFYD